MQERLGIVDTVFEKKELLFPGFDKQSYMIRIEKNLTQLEDVLGKNPDIYRLGIEIFKTESAFLDWYNSLSNRGQDHGIPDGCSKIDALVKLQDLEPNMLQRGIEAFGGKRKKFYKALLSYDKNSSHSLNNNTIPLFFSPKDLSKYMVKLEYGNNN